MAIKIYSPFKEGSLPFNQWLKQENPTNSDQIFIQLNSKSSVKYNVQNIPADSCIFLTSKAKNNFISQILTGFSSSDLHTNAIVCNTKTAFDLSTYNLTSPNEWIYAFKKNTLSQNNVFINNQTTTSSLKQTFLQKQQLRFNFLKQSLKANPLYLVFLGLACVLLFAMPTLSKNAGISGDEILQHEYGKIILSYHSGEIDYDTNKMKTLRFEPDFIKKAKELGSNLATIKDEGRVMHLYGSGFDLICAFLCKKLNVEDVYTFRHKVNAIFGWLIVVFGALIVRRLTNSWLYAILSLGILFLTPRILGESFNNPKDIPFAAGYTIAIYYALCAFQNIQQLQFRHLIGIVLGIGLAISIRIGGLLAIAVVGFYAILKYIESIGIGNFLKLKWINFPKTLLLLVGTFFFAYTLGVYFWPWGMQDFFGNPLKALSEFSNYSGSVRQLFQGVMYDSDYLPRHYLSTYIFITLPIVSLIGLGIWVITTILNKKIPLAIFIVFFAAVFPVLYIYIQKSNVYGGLRHILFTLPMFIATAIVGWYQLAKLLTAKIPKFGKYTIALPALLTLSPAIFIVKNHPLEYIYFNETVGGTAGAYGKYEMDYYLAGLKSSTDWFLNNIVRKEPTKRFNIASYDVNIVKEYCKNDTNVGVGFIRYDDRGGAKWEYAIFYNSFMDAGRLLSNNYPPKGTIYSPMVDGKPMGLVIKRISTIDIQANKYLNSNPPNADSAIILFKEYLKLDPNNNEVLLKLAQAYAINRDVPNVEKYGNMAIKIYPEYSVCRYLLAQVYINVQQYDKAIKQLDLVLASRPKESQAYYMRSICKANKQNIIEATSDIKDAIKIDPMNNEFLKTAVQLLQASNAASESQRFSKAINDPYTRNEIYFELSGKYLQGMEPTE